MNPHRNGFIDDFPLANSDDLATSPSMTCPAPEINTKNENLAGYGLDWPAGGRPVAGITDSYGHAALKSVTVVDTLCLAGRALGLLTAGHVLEFCKVGGRLGSP